jgi:hypothetical protein
MKYGKLIKMTFIGQSFGFYALPVPPKIFGSVLRLINQEPIYIGL